MAEKKRGLNFNDASVQNIFAFNNYKQPTQPQQPIKTEPQPTTEAKPQQTYTSHTQKTTDKGLKDGDTRTTLAIAKRHLQILDALSSYTSISKINILTQLLDKGLDELKKTHPTLTDDALKQFCSINKSLF